MSTTLTSAQSEALATLPGMVVRLGPLRSRLTDEEFEKFCAQNPELRIEMTSEGVMIITCPDFVVELRSKTDRLRTLQNKMKEYMGNGARLGWLIDPIRHQVHVYHADSAVEILDHPQVISGEPLLPGFVLRLDAIID